ncbi:NUDIX hydrolase [Gymnodinialimonas hymeniacidonis]|uniref:NUDIX hydrolase n=1 Tax=Gymnodinialimonas hymeniacidonis TaxID=3126508 RepID=UPI0034C5CFE8
MADETVTHHWRPSPYPRCIAIGLIKDNGRLLCAEVTCDDGGIKGYRPLGGGIEIGETAADALAREFKEEVRAEVKVGPRRAVLENIFQHEGALGHEIVFVHEAVVIRPGLIQPKRFLLEEAGRVTALDWVPLDSFKSGQAVLFPDGVLALL